ncbi:sensor histidine kinase [Marinilabilia salmonicolor]|uniref:sensor histidine kinase n=1 Tax=Marinilabilia salmonicolor TaxID=989 RepID=UPI00029ACAD2|nr:PAS domain-containing sensor histidine kinase [Marinilabilia salmonicolor]
MNNPKKTNLIQQHKLDRFCIDHAGIGIYQISDTDGHIISVNQQACNDLGYSKEELESMTIFELDPNFSEPYNGKWHSHRDNIRKAGTGTIETLHKRKDGSLMPVEVTITYMQFDGRTISFSFARDITKRKEAEQTLREKEEAHRKELQESRNYFSNLLNNLPGMAFRCRNFNTWPMEFVSDGTKKITGYDKSDFIDGNIRYGDLIYPGDREKVWNTIQEAIKKRKPYLLEYRMITKNRTEKWVWEQGSIADNSPFSEAILEGFITDITEQKKLEQKLKENDRLKTAFLQNISHEIRTPLNAILGFSELIKHPGLKDTERAEYIGIIQSGGEKLLSILNNVLELSRIETGSVTIDSSAVPVNTLLKNLHALFSKQAKEKQLELLLKIPEKETTITSDYTKLDQILTNLINNAIKYTEKGIIKFGFEKREKDLLFFVKDTGPGISKEQQDRVFERFYRSDDPKLFKHEGAGLGLSICMGFIKILKGKIWLESDPGEGTSFYFTLPHL